MKVVGALLASDADIDGSGETDKGGWDGDGGRLLAGATEVADAEEIGAIECWLSAATLGFGCGLRAKAAPAMATTATAAVVLAAMR